MAAQKVTVDEALAAEHGLTPEEYESIIAHLGRTPTLEELGVFSVMWSEHCSYKSSRVHLKKFPTSGTAVLQGPGENAGAVDIGGGMAAVFKIESHNHPSYVEPYQGAATGVGGILRDVFTMGARPVANLNSLRFGSPEHPRTPYLLGGVVRGIGDYGNCVGVPTVGGEIYFDAGYDGNILVNAFTLGVVRADKLFRAVASGKGNPVLYVGSKTGRDGIHGASLLASSEFKEESEQMRPTVQVGDPFTENLLIEACLEVMAGDDVVAIQDMGAAGLTSSSVEMAGRGGVGIRLDLDRIPLREDVIPPYEILLSESQERMVLVVKQGRQAAVSEFFARWGLSCVEIGEVTDDQRFSATYRGEEVASIPVAALTDAAPAYERPISPRPPRPVFDPDTIAVPAGTEAHNRILIDLIGSANLCSRRWVYDQYDSYVGANTVIHPGGDAALVRVRETGAGLALTTDCNSRYVDLDARVGAAHAVAEAVRNVAVTGAKPLAISDCLNFGNPEKPDVMGQFADAIEGMAEACRVFDAPVISGNVSFYNDTRGHSIPPTPVVALVGLCKDASATAVSGFRSEGESIYLLGDGRPEFGGSAYLALCHGQAGDRPPVVDLEGERKLSWLCADIIADGLVSCAHDVAEGGLAVALAEMCLTGQGPGCTVDTEWRERSDLALFGESGCRILLTVAPERAADLEKAAAEAGVGCRRLGSTGGNAVSIKDGDQTVLQVEIQQLRDSWEATLPAIAGRSGSARDGS